MNESVAKVVEAIIENRKRFEAFCLSLTEEETKRPVPNSTWVVKDFASHLGTLDTLFIRYTQNAASGTPIDMTNDGDGGDFNLDRWNDAQVAERRAWPMRRILDEAAVNRAALIEALGSLDEEHLAAMMHFSDPKRGTGDFPLKLFLVGWAQHDPIHAADMVKALPERAADADLHAWLTNPFVTGYQKAMSGPDPNGRDSLSRT